MNSYSGSSNLNLRHLRALHAIWREGSFARAAERLGIVPSALTETVRQVEEIVGGRLFDRSVRPPIATPLGLAFFKETEPLVRNFDRAFDRLRDQARGLQTTLRIGATPSTISSLIAPALVRFRAEHPNIVITLHDDVAERLAVMVLNGQLDIAIAGRAHTSSDLLQIEIGSDRFGLACHHMHLLAQRTEPVKLADIDAGSVIHLGSDTGSARLLSDHHALPERLRRGTLETYSTIAQLCLVRSGVGVALLPRSAVLLFNDPAIRFVEVVDLQLVRRIYLLQSHATPPSAMAQRFIDLLR